VPRIGILSPSSLLDARTPRLLAALKAGLHALGHVEGQNVAIEARWAAGQYDRLPGLAAELIRLSAIAT